VLDGVAQEHEAFVEGALLEQRELATYAVGQRGEAAADDHGHEEEAHLVDQARPPGLGREGGARHGHGRGVRRQPDGRLRRDSG